MSAMDPSDPGFLSEAFRAALSNAGGLLIGVVLLIVLLLAVSLTGRRGGGSGSDVRDLSL